MDLELLSMTSTVHVGKKLTTNRRGKGGEDEAVTCSIALKGLRLNRAQLALIAGLPATTIGPLYNEMGMPFQRMSVLLTKRELVGVVKIEHRRDSGAAIASLTVATAQVLDIRFGLDVPEEAGPTAMLSFTLLWKAAGDEVEDVRDLLGRSCYIAITFKEPPQQMSIDQPPPATPEPLDRKRLAAGEGRDKDDGSLVNASPQVLDAMLGQCRALLKSVKKISIKDVQDAFEGIGFNRAAWMLEQLEAEGLVGPLNNKGVREVKPVKIIGDKFKADVEAAARKHPRKPAAKPKGKR